MSEVRANGAIDDDGDPELNGKMPSAVAIACRCNAYFMSKLSLEVDQSFAFCVRTGQSNYYYGCQSWF